MRLLAAHPDEGFTITEIGRRLRLNKATFYPMIVALTEAGWLLRDPTTKTYRLGPELITLGEAAGKALPAVPLARPAMVELATELGVTCGAFTLSEGMVTLVDQVWDVRSTVQPLRVGLWAPLRAPYSAMFVAWDDDAVADWLGTVTPEAERRYAAAIKAIRERGYVVELRVPAHEPVTGTASVAALMPMDPADEPSFLLGPIDPTRSYAVATIEAPVFDPMRGVALGLVLVGLPATMKGSELDAYGRRLVAAAEGVSKSRRA